MSDDDPTTPDPGADDAGAAGATGPGGPTILTRQELRRQRQGESRRTRYVVAAAIVVVVVAGAVLAATLHGSSPKAKRAAAATTTTTRPATGAATCPLTGAPAPGGVVPARPALAMKIGNYTDDRPSAGLDQADIVFEEPVEGSYTRLVAVFQCQGATLVGDLRSAREPDVAILSQLSDPLFMHAGGIDPVLALLADAPIRDENILDGGMGPVTIHPSGRYAPYDTFSSTGPVWGLAPSDTKPPAPIFTYSATPPAGSVPGSGASVHIPFSSTSDVTWTWDPATGTYLRSYSGVPDTLVNGSQTHATNVVVMTVHTFTGPWAENSEGGYEVEVVATGSGPLVVLRNGIAITGTWTRSSLTGPATLTAADGAPITLQPGNTWEELAPVGIPVTTAADPVPPTTTTVPANKKSTKA
ncbi:MAG: DUF3048 domain-containing protein [Acidimicrobiales bacterium]|jgi:hypothetical protein